MAFGLDVILGGRFYRTISVFVGLCDGRFFAEWVKHKGYDLAK